MFEDSSQSDAASRGGRSPAPDGAGSPDATILPGHARNRSTPSEPSAGQVTIRPARLVDGPEVLELFRNGSLSGEIGDPQEAPDLEDLGGAYLEADDAWLWVATDNAAPDGPLLGMVAVRQADDDVAELRRLRVRDTHRGRGIGRALVEHALQHCRSHDFLKVVLDTFVERRAAIGLFEQFGFRHARSRQADGREILDFYLDLYSDSQDGAPSPTP
ncbi:MAG: GNAT family N-acetyltransferase [Phycisphaerales bacterium]